MAARDPEVDAYIARMDPKLAPIARAARTAIRRSAPGLRERICMGIPHWEGEQLVCYVADYSRHVNLGFHQGAKLRDRQGLLEGTGKGLRHVKLRAPEDARRPGVATLVREAAALDARLARRSETRRRSRAARQG